MRDIPSFLCVNAIKKTEVSRFLCIHRTTSRAPLRRGQNADKPCSHHQHATRKGPPGPRGTSWQTDTGASRQWLQQNALKGEGERGLQEAKTGPEGHL